MARTAPYWLAALALAVPAAMADTLLIENVVEAAPGAAERPHRGVSMARVETRWGPPEARSGAVGQPPITRWDYPGFAVFFEYDHVVHTVRKP